MAGQVRPYASSAQVNAWFDITDDDRFACPGGWLGTFSQMDNGFFAELIDGACPQCDRMLVIRSLPTAEEVRRAASAGNVEALRMLDQQVHRGEDTSSL